MDVDVESKINLFHKGIRVPLFHEFCLDYRRTETGNNIWNTTREDLVSNRFKNGVLELDDLP